MANSAKISNRDDFCQKANFYYEDLKENVWAEFFPVPVFSGSKDFQMLCKLLSELQILSKSEILKESQFLMIFPKIYDQLFWRISPFKFDFEQLKDIITTNWRNSYKFLTLLYFSEIITCF